MWKEIMFHNLKVRELVEIYSLKAFPTLAHTTIHISLYFKKAIKQLWLSERYFVTHVIPNAFHPPLAPAAGHSQCRHPDSFPQVPASASLFPHLPSPLPQINKNFLND